MNKRCFSILLIGITVYAASAYPLKCYKIGSADSVTEGKAECVMELYSRRILYEKNGDTRLPMASTTKIATAITVLNSCKNLSEKVEIPPEAVGIEGSSVYLKSGEIYTVEELLYGLMLRSGNDCATALALYCSENIKEFSAKMNETAQKAGALETRFANPHGLPNKNHYTTARDLSYISCLAMENETFQKIVSTKYFEPRHWKNKNKMLTQYENAVGIKTGYTKEAGRCLVSAAEKDAMTLVCTVLNCGPMYERSVQLLDDAFSVYQYIPIVEKGAKMLVKSSDNEIVGVSHESFYYPLADGEEEQIEITVKPFREKNNKEIIGQFDILLSKRLLFSGKLYKL